MNIDGLTTEQKETVLRFLLYRMGQDTRGKLMAELPVAYARLYPEVSPAVVIGAVAKTLSTPAP